ncbi:MAG: hypothetical protein EBW27_07505, partial [Acidimicrobiia bacterium]|nr:hypothetical protein [Acidimicrobiia bacterium]
MNILSRLLRRTPADPDALQIEPMRKSHLAEVMAIESVSYPAPWTKTVFEDELAMQARGSRHYLVARLGDRLVGYGGMIYMDDAAHI